MTEMPRQGIGCGPALEVHDTLKTNLILQLLMKEEENNDDTVIATQEPPTAAREELGATDQQFSNAQVAFILKAMTTLEALLVLRKEPIPEER